MNDPLEPTFTLSDPATETCSNDEAQNSTRVVVPFRQTLHVAEFHAGSPEGCPHLSFVLDQKARQVFCKTCREKLDLYETLSTVLRDDQVRESRIAYYESLKKQHAERERARAKGARLSSEKKKRESLERRIEEARSVSPEQARSGFATLRTSLP